MAYRSGDVSLVPAPFPTRRSYADIHHALIEEGYTDWAESLVEYAWKKMAGG